MTQHVFDNAMVAHVWANQKLFTNHGRSHNGNFFFNGRTIYSYGSHFIAGIVTHDGAFILNSDSYSPTTAKHMSYVHRAVHGTKVYYIPGLTRIASDILTITGERSAESKMYAKGRLRIYLDSAALDLSAESGRYLYAMVSRGSWLKFRARKQAAADKLAARNRKRLAQSWRRSAANWAKMPADEFRQQLRALMGNEHEWTRERDWKNTLSDLHNSHRASGGKRVKARLWAMIKQARDYRKRDSKALSIYRDIRRSISDLRRLQREPDFRREIFWNRNPRQWQTIAQHFSIILESAPGLSSALRSALEQARERAARVQARAARIADFRAQQQRKRQMAEQYAKEAEKRSKWLQGDSIGYWHGSDESGGALIRAIDAQIEGCTVLAGTLQTSWGASVPLAHAVRAFRFIKALRGKPWSANGKTIAVGHFRISEIKPTGDLIAGCHRINWGEIERLAVQLGVFDCAPIDESMEAAVE